MMKDVESSVGTLKPTLEAAMTVDDYFGGFIAAANECAKFRLRAFTVVIAAGLGKSFNDKDMQKLVYEAGVQNLAKSVSDFVALLSLGGQIPDPDDKKDDSKPGE